MRFMLGGDWLFAFKFIENLKQSGCLLGIMANTLQIFFILSGLK